MERMALVSDVHGNLTAYEAVLADIDRRGIDRIFNLGDYVGKGPRGREVIELSQQRCEVNLLGNWDDFLPDPNRKFDDEALRFWLSQLRPGQGDWLRSLPFSHDFWLSGRRVRLFHASEETVHRRVRYVRTQDEFEALFRHTEATEDGPVPDLIGYADTHDPMYEVQLEGRTVFNTGSVGNCMGDPTPMYCILEGEVGSEETAPWAVSYVRVPYDVEAELAVAREMGMPHYDGYELELRHGIYRGSLEEWRVGEPVTGYHER
ncbi:metallophosphoesterase family protein [Knoellia sp. S7-12]|uniref:metallophosphoesterase family protein n=1 Tax=Knoellia sp. S7-12 TaxID=3126698 RepID=UPI0033666673